jgi:hypothetical protein
MLRRASKLGAAFLASRISSRISSSPYFCFRRYLILSFHGVHSSIGCDVSHHGCYICAHHRHMFFLLARKTSSTYTGCVRDNALAFCLVGCQQQRIAHAHITHVCRWRGLALTSETKLFDDVSLESHGGPHSLD